VTSEAPTDLAIEVRGLVKRYRGGRGQDELSAVRGIDLGVRRGEVFGFLGPNGAGKTTTVRMLCTLLPITEGHATVAGVDVGRDPAEVRRRIGVALQEVGLDARQSGRELLELQCGLYRIADPAARSAELLRLVGLEDAADRLIGTYSGGMKRRLDLATALVHEPQVLFLDEPTTGLDPRSRIDLWETIEQRVAEGSTVLLTTQYLDEADRLSDRIAVIDHGAVIAEGTADELKHQVAVERLEVVLGPKADPAAAATALAPMGDGHAPSVEGSVVTVPIGRRPGAIVEAVRRLDSAGEEVLDVAVRRPTLNDVFLTLTGHAAEDSAGEDTR